MQLQLPNRASPAEALALLDRLQRSIKHLPQLLDAGLCDEVGKLDTMLRDNGFPRVMLMGRRGSGKSSLVNALVNRRCRPVGAVKAQTGTAVWTQIGIGENLYELLDTRGFQEGSRPVEGDSAASVEESLRDAVGTRAPDLILFVVKAKEVDAAIATDLDILQRLHGFIADTHGRAVPILGVLNQCDELEPMDIKRLPTDDEDKRASINSATAALVEHLAARPALIHSVIRSPLPTVAAVVFDEQGTPLPGRDYRWNIDTLAAALGDGMIASASYIGRSQAIQAQRRRAAEALIRVCSVAATVPLPPIPGLDLLPIAKLREFLVGGIGLIAGYDLNHDQVQTIIRSVDSNLGNIPLSGGDALRNAARFIPLVGVGAGMLIGGQQIDMTGRSALSYLLDAASLETLRDHLARRFSFRRGGKSSR